MIETQEVAKMPTIGTDSPLNGTGYLFIMMGMSVWNYANVLG